MKNKKHISVLLIIIILFVHNFSFADINSVRNEGANAPSTSPSGDNTDPGIGGPGVEENTETIITTILHSSVSGYAFEDLNQYDDLRYKYLEKDANEPGIQDVVVQLIDQSGNVHRQITTDSNGYYRFDPGSYTPGNYRVRFIYGCFVNELHYYTDDRIKNILKYNGQDYKAQTIGTTRSKLMTTWEETIIKRQKGCSQIFLLLDCSNSMLKPDNNGDIRLDIEKESAKKLAEDLLKANKNIYIGVIGFGETAVVRKQLSNDIEAVKYAIDNIINFEEDIYNTSENISYGSGTNIAEAVDKAKVSFANNDPNTSNRSIILLSDGAPTIFGNSKVYNSDSDQQIINKCNYIAERTNEKLKQIRDEGIKITTIIPKTNDEFEDGLINKVLEGDIGKYYKPESMNKIAEIINSEFVTEIETDQKENVIWNTGTDFANDDNIDRRKWVNSNFAIMDYNNIKAFDNIKNYTGDKDLIKDLAEKTYMYVETKEYELNGYVTESNHYDPITNTRYMTIDEPWKDQNLILQERDPSALDVDMHITGMRVTLSDGNIFEENIKQVKTDKDVASGDTQEIESIANIGQQLVKSVDTELIHGAKVEFEYTIIVKNNSTYNFTEFELIDYIPNGLTMDPNAKLLSEDYYNKDYGWRNESKNDIKIESNKLASMYNNIYPIAKINGGLEPIRDGEIGTNGERYIKVVLQAIVNAGADDLNYENEVELYSYSNTEGRRMGKSEKDLVSDITKVNYVKVSDGLDFDFAKEAKIIIIPPTGIWHNYLHILITIIVFFIGVRSFKMYIEERRTR